MKDLGAAKQIRGMRINRNMAQGTLTLSQAEYIRRVLERFNMHGAKAVNTPLGSHFKFSHGLSSKTNAQREYMAKVLNTSAIDSLMYAMVNTRSKIAHAMGVVSRFANNPGKQQ